MKITRRRLLAISAAFALLPTAARAAVSTGSSHVWTGQAMGARASIRIDHPDAEAIAARVMAEIDRLENILSLYRADSALSRLNREGQLAAPPFELLECLSLAGAVHRASGGRFDPTIQPLWALWAETAMAGTRPDPQAIKAVLGRTGWGKVTLDAAAITMQPGMALTLNGSGQGYVADRVAARLEAEGLSNILIDTGEFRALGGRPDGADWPMQLEGGGSIGLRQRALATSSPLGTTFDQAGSDGHILDPVTGTPTAAPWRTISISAHSAAIADALTTAACLMAEPASIQSMLEKFAGAHLEACA
ncbi:MAG: FAD:protein FMN transferase [Devosia sp.]|nr:FAD:protein FMN transferase [Devosia sp.]